MQKSEPIVEYRDTFATLRNQQEGKRDPFKPESAQRIEFEVITNKFVMDGEMYNAGVYSTEIYAKRLPAWEALVEKHPEKVAEAKQKYAAEEARVKDDKYAPRTFTSVPQAYSILTGGETMGALAYLKPLEVMGPPHTADELKSAATTKAIVEAIVESRSASSKK